LFAILVNIEKLKAERFGNLSLITSFDTRSVKIRLI
jgi:hypothetical protein